MEGSTDLLGAFVTEVHLSVTQTKYTDTDILTTIPHTPTKGEVTFTDLLGALVTQVHLVVMQTMKYGHNDGLGSRHPVHLAAAAAAVHKCHLPFVAK